MKHRLTYWLAYAGMLLLASLPLRVLYVVSDVLYVLLRHVLGYRRRTVRSNLRNSFPEKTAAELRDIEKRFYHYICDYVVEEIKTLRITADELQRRMVYENPEAIVNAVREHRCAFLMMPHYGSFEWTMGLALALDKDCLPIQIYKPLHNKYMDNLFLHIRSRFGGINVPKHSTARSLLKLHREGKAMAVGFITDQSPNRNEARYWTTFLNRDTVFMDGAEKLAKMFDAAVFYCDIRRERRGYSRIRFRLLTETPKQTADGEITESFARCLEESIRRDPPYWFWSHKRWKIKREDV